MYATASSSSPHIKRYHVFLSFHSGDVRRKFLSHLHYHFESKGIKTFKDHEMERGKTIGPELKQAIRESRIYIVVLSEKYASSSWCLDELVEIMKCKEKEQRVMTIFYDVDPSHVRNQSGVFGAAFMDTCVRKSVEKRQRWRKALTDVANIIGEHSLSWNDEAKMIQKIVVDVSNKLNVSPSMDFDMLVGLEGHLEKLETLLFPMSKEVKIIGIWGPAGIGKTTIARALYKQLSADFRIRCFMENIKGSSNGFRIDNNDSKLRLQNQLLSKILNQKDIIISHLGAVEEWLHDQKVLLVLDDVDDIKQLETLANKPCWFGHGSRIIVTTKDKRILKAHGIKYIYRVGFPSKEEALEILCLHAFKQSYPQEGFKELACKVAKLCGNLPLGLCIVGSSLHGDNMKEWELRLQRLETSLDREIENVLSVGYEKLLKKDQDLFLHIACIFNYENVDHMTTLLTDSNLSVGNGLTSLVEKSFVHISIDRRIVMHSLLQQFGRQLVIEQSNEPGRRQFLVEAQEIRDVLENETGTGFVIGISADMSDIKKLSISKGAFKGMRNLRFLRFYTSKKGIYQQISLLGDIEYLPCLKLLDWNYYPSKHLPEIFRPEYLIELRMKFSKLEKLWQGIQPLVNIKKMDFSYSLKLKEIPNLSEAPNLEIMRLVFCKSLVERPTSIMNLHKLKRLMMKGCKKLKVIPTNINLASLEEVNMSNCSQLRSFPDISENIKHLDVRNTRIEEVPPSIDRHWSSLTWLHIGSRNLKGLSYVPKSIIKLDLRNSNIEALPDCVIDLPFLQSLIIQNCRKLVSLRGLPRSLWCLDATDCRSLKSVFHTFNDPCASLNYRNCVQLEDEARRRIIQQWSYNYVCLPGNKVPMDSTNKARGNSITIPMDSNGVGTFSTSSRFKACLLLSPIKGYPIFDITCRLRNKNGLLLNEVEYWISGLSPKFLTEHLLIFFGDLFETDKCHELDATTSEILFEFSCRDNDDKIIECGVQILKDEGESSSSNNEENNYETYLRHHFHELL
ncbi:unnamed protein product [Cochlearia groenlandica]